MNSRGQAKVFVKTIRSQSGFSLVEILIALTLLGFGGTFIAGKIFQSFHDGSVKAAKIQMNGYKQALKDYKRKCYRYPTSEQGLDALVEKPSGGKECNNYPPDGFIEDLQVDPWDNDYVYESDGKKFTIKSYGADGEPGGEGNDKDIDLAAKKKKQSDN